MLATATMKARAPLRVTGDQEMVLIRTSLMPSSNASATPTAHSRPCIVFAAGRTQTNDDVLRFIGERAIACVTMTSPPISLLLRTSRDVTSILYSKTFY